VHFAFHLPNLVPLKLAGLFFKIPPMKRIIACLSIVVLVASCSEGKKKVIIISEGTADVNLEQRTVTTKGRGHEEKTALFYGDGSMELKVTSASGSATVTLADNGVYFLNTKKDTIVGSFVNYTAPKKTSRTISDAEMQSTIWKDLFYSS